MLRTPQGSCSFLSILTPHPSHFFHPALAPKPTPLTISIKASKSGKEALLADYVKAISTSSSSFLPNGDLNEATSAELPNDRFIDESPDDAEGWITFKEPILYV